MSSNGPGWEVFTKYPVNVEIPQVSILDSSTFLLNCLMTLMMMLSAMLLSMLMIPHSILSVSRHLICGKLELAPELASVLWKTLEWGMKWIVVSIAEKIEFVTLVWSSNSCAIDVKMDWYVLGYKSSFKMLVLSLLNLSVLFWANFLSLESTFYLCKFIMLLSLNWCHLLLLGCVW